jgi:nicotinate-nucleotide pyrophosphorylase (carboxylating)
MDVTRGWTELGRIVELALAEDLGEEGDITSQAVFFRGEMGAARVIAREACTISGLEAAAETCRQVDSDLAWMALVEAGQDVPAGAEVARLEGKLLSILAAERTLLNFLARLSGIATLTRRYVDALEGSRSRVAATRKTSPGMRYLEKQAVLHGGGETHRAGLYDAVLIKDNHIAAAGGVNGAVRAVRDALGGETPIEVEVDTPVQLEEALAAGVEAVLLDNMEPERVRDCVESASGRALVEASGGITLENVRAYAEAGAEVISAGALTNAAAAVDLSLEVVS